MLVNRYKNVYLSFISTDLPVSNGRFCQPAIWRESGSQAMRPVCMQQLSGARSPDGRSPDPPSPNASPACTAVTDSPPAAARNGRFHTG